MPNVRMLRNVHSPDGSGPGNGMWALQRALQQANFPWLKIGGALQSGEIPWAWLYRDVPVVLVFAHYGWPFIIGPNVLFASSANPGKGKYETALLDCDSCVMQFTESEWYAALIHRHCDRNEAPIVLWRYPIDPQPAEPLPVEYDLLIYLKDMKLGREVIRARERWPNSNIVVYGHYQREAMIDLARRSRFAIYLSSDDRGPLALAEIMLSGCPTIGIPYGAPWIENHVSGISIPHWGLMNEAEQLVQTIDRNAVRAWALDAFSTAKTVEIIRSALEPLT